MSNLNIICEALNAGKRVQLDYKGHTRKMEVHSVGMSKKGNLSMLTYQVGGGSNGQKKEGWKFMIVDEASPITILDEPSEAPRQGYRGGVRGMIEIYAQVPVPQPPEVGTEAVTTTSH